MSQPKLAYIARSTDRMEVIGMVRATPTNRGFVIDVRRILIAVRAESTFRLKNELTKSAPLRGSVEPPHILRFKPNCDGLAVDAVDLDSMPDDDPIGAGFAVSNISGDTGNVRRINRFNRLKNYFGDRLVHRFPHKSTGTLSLIHRTSQLDNYGLIHRSYAHLVDSTTDFEFTTEHRIQEKRGF